MNLRSSATPAGSGGPRPGPPRAASARSWYPCRCSRPLRRITSPPGNPHAPRLIALDEAFAGVDDDLRAKCLGLLATFDMDVVYDQRARVGLLPAGARTWHLPSRPPGRRSRGPGHAVAVGRPGTPQGRPGGGMTDSAIDTAEDGTRLHRLLGGEPTAWLVQRARDRLEAGRPRPGP